MPAHMQDMERPDEEEVEATMRETQAALDRLVNGKIIAAQPKTLPARRTLLCVDAVPCVALCMHAQIRCLQWLQGAA